VIKVLSVPKLDTKVFHIDRFSGLNKAVTPTQIEVNESPDMLNMQLDSKGALEKRTGFISMIDSSLGDGEITGAYSGLVDGKFLFTHSTTLYAYNGVTESQDGGDSTTTSFSFEDGGLSTTVQSETKDGGSSTITPQAIKTGISNSRSRFFAIGSDVYMMNGSNFLKYDGSTVTNIYDSPYTPTVTLGRTPSGGGTANEEFNLLGSGFTDSFSGNGTDTVYQMSLTSLDATTITALVNNVAVVEGVGFTANRTTGAITFSVAPTSGTNNVLITAYKTISGNKEKILNCKYQANYGGTNDTRLFVTGNVNYGNTIWRTGIDILGNPDMTYFPELAYMQIGTSNDRIVGLSKQYDALIVHKQKSMYRITYLLTNGVASFPSVPINDVVGCKSPDTIQIINNIPVFLFDTGVFTLTQSSVRDERNVQHISNNIDVDLLSETGDILAHSIDFDNKYIISVNGNCYVYDYIQKLWYKWNNINSSCLFIVNDYLYFGSSTIGQFYKFKKKNEVSPYSDNGVAINAYWKSKMLSLNADAYLKFIDKLFYKMTPFTRSSISAYYITEKGEEVFLGTSRMDLLDFGDIDFGQFSFLTSRFPQEIRERIRCRKVNILQIVLKNNVLNEAMGLLSIDVMYNIQREVR
jgi:hypothetical protein